VLDVLRRVARGELSPEEAAGLLRGRGVRRLGETAVLDLDRRLRTGVPEVVLAGPKRPAEVAEIAAALLERTGSACVSRMRRRHRRAVAAVAAARGAQLVAYGRRSCRLVAAGVAAAAPPHGLVGLLAAGTSDLEPLAEARMVCEAAGCATTTAVDVGVAGLERVLAPLGAMLAAGADALVVAAGMDGALPSVVAGLAGVPVVGLPVSTGYGVGGRGRAALLAMLQGCAPGLVVVNVDNGVGAGAAAALVALRSGRGGASRPPSEAAGVGSLPRGGAALSDRAGAGGPASARGAAGG
jgi:pyridinium-3,5-biscarboxylic acid mononucleotide synthase